MKPVSMKQVHPDLKNNKQKTYIYILLINRRIDVTWSDSIAHQTCSSGTHGVVGHIFHHHPTRKASSDSLPRNWYQVIYIKFHLDHVCNHASCLSYLSFEDSHSKGFACAAIFYLFALRHVFLKVGVKLHGRKNRGGTMGTP